MIDPQVYARRIAGEISLRPEQVAATITLLDDGNTLPFVARYRKEATGGLDEEQIRQVSVLLSRQRALDERRETVLSTIAASGQLTPELEQRIHAAETLTVLEDLYQPYKPKRRTRASIAREKGLQELADLIAEQVVTAETLEEIAAPFFTDEVPTAEEALAGARDIVAEMISDHPDVRGLARQKALQWGVLRTERVEQAEDPRGVYRDYYDFEGRVERMRPHQVLAINRGEAEKILRVRVEVPERDWREAVGQAFRAERRSPLAEQLELAIVDSAARLLLPAIERDVRRHLSEAAQEHAIGIFARNLRALLGQPPLAGHVVMGIDPGYRTGCKVAVVDSTGKVLDTATIYPHEPQREWEEAFKAMKLLIHRHGVTLIAVGNGTASRETEQLAAEVIRAVGKTRYLVVNEAGASVYSASSLARAELPDLDVSMRGAVSISRRVQDPLAELVKIDPQSIGVGLYQHDVDQRKLSETLAGVVESVVNNVGVDLNTASPALLAHVAGIGPKQAERIVAYRDAHGPFGDRTALLQVPGLGPKSFEQAAGFLRIRSGREPLDGTAIHPESYAVARAMLEQAGLAADSSLAERETALEQLQKRRPLHVLAEELGTGGLTLRDILEQLLRPGRDPRADLPAPILRTDVLSLKDLEPGMRLKGTVRNVVDFGAFVDIGVKDDGLLHRSRLPAEVKLQVGDVIEVEVVNVEPERGRIALRWAGI